MNISYIDFWPGFNPNSNWFNQVFKDVLDHKEVNFLSTPEEADVIVSATFGSAKQRYKESKAIKIFYTGENVPPDLVNCDYSLSFNQSTCNGKNFRLPHWYLYIDWWNQVDCDYAEISQKELLGQWDPEELWERPYFCSLIIGNPVQNRLDLAGALSSYKAVYGYGSVFNNPFSGSKMQLLKNFKFNICFENTSSAGYITEKLLQAKVAGCIPLYFGHASVKDDFNERSFLNYNDFSETEKFLDLVKSTDSDKSKFLKIAREPLFDRPPNLDPLYSFLRKILV